MSKNRRAVSIETMERRVMFDASALSEAITASTLPTSISDQDVLKGAVTVEVTNTSGTPEKFKADVKVVTAGGALDISGGQYAQLASKVTEISLAAGASKAYVVRVSVAKGKLTDGTGTLLAVVSDTTGAESQSPAGSTLTVHTPIIALSETEVFYKLPATIAPETKIKWSDKVSITNSGSDPSATPLTIAVYASNVTGAIPLATVFKKITINAGRTAVVGIAIRDNAGLAAGDYKLIAVVTQTNGTVTQTPAGTAPSIDVPAPATTAEFTDSIVTATPQYNQSNGALNELNFLMFIQNNGVTSNGPNQFTLYASTSPTFSSSAVQVASLPLTQYIEGNGGTASFQLDVDVPPLQSLGLTAQSYYVFLKVTAPDGSVSMAGDSTPVIFNSTN
jgi:hypothetical protein